MLAPGTSEETRKRLQERIAAHNHDVFSLTAGNILLATALWGGLCFIAYWLTALGMSVAHGTEAVFPKDFLLYFLLAAAALLSMALLDQKLSSPRRLPPDHRSTGEVLYDVLLAIPRVTIAIPGNLSALLRMSPEEVEAGALLLNMVAREQRIPVYRLPAEIPDAQLREKLILSLLLLELLELYQEENEPWMRLSGKARQTLLFRQTV